MNYYAVKKGRNPGIYLTWAECQNETKGFSGAEFKKFNNIEDAKAFINGNSIKSAELKEEKSADIDRFIDSDTLIAYVDGSFNKKNSSYSYGAVFLKDGKVIHKSNKRYKKDEFSEHRNVIGEIRGSEYAMDYAIKNNYKKLILHYDYEGIEKWAIGSWRRNKKATILYHEFYKEASKNLEVIFVKVLAHSGVEYNEMADKLAKSAILED